MKSVISNLVERFENGNLSRRDLVQGLTMLFAAASVPMRSATAADTPAAPGLTPTGIDHVSVLVSDVERSAKFYQDLFGLSVLSTDKEHGIVRTRAQARHRLHPQGEALRHRRSLRCRRRELQQGGGHAIAAAARPQPGRELAIRLLCEGSGRHERAVRLTPPQGTALDARAPVRDRPRRVLECVLGCSAARAAGRRAAGIVPAPAFTATQLVPRSRARTGRPTAATCSTNGTRRSSRSTGIRSPD